MTTNQTTATELRWPPDVTAFATRHGVRDYLPQVWEMTQRVFPTAERLGFQMEEDAETPDDWRIVVHVEAPLSAPQLVADQQRWYDALLDLCPSAHAVWFCLALYPVT